MLVDKFRSIPGLGKVSIFTILGMANVVGYGLSHVMNRDTYRYHFAYDGAGRHSTNFARSLSGSETVVGTAMNVGFLVGCGQYMQRKVGLLTMMKFAPMPFLATFAFYQAFPPNAEKALVANRRFKLGLDKLRLDSHTDKFYMGADSVTAGLVYFTVFYHKAWLVGAGFIALDTIYYGPMYLGGPLSAAAGALVLLN